MDDTLNQADQSQADQPQADQPQADQSRTNQRKCQSASAAKMRSSRFDLVTSFLTSVMILLGSGVGILFLIWALSTSHITTSEPLPVSRISFASLGIPDAEPEFEVPTQSETESLAEPTLQDTVSEISTIQLSGIAQSDSNDAATSLGDPRGTKQGNIGDGTDEIGNNQVPAFERWNLTFQAANAEAYARQLDALGIELAVFGGGKLSIDCLTSLSSNPRHYRIDEPKNEQRLYFSWLEQQSSQTLIAYEKQWLRAASIPTQNRHLIKFIPPQLESELADAELTYARQHGVRSVDAIAKTVFESRPSTNGFQLVVIHQRYRTQRDQQQRD